MSEWLTLDEAATLTGRSKRTVQRWLQQNPEAFEQREGGWSGSNRTQLVSRESLTAFATANGLNIDEQGDDTVSSDDAPQHDNSVPQHADDAPQHDNGTPQRAGGAPEERHDVLRHDSGAPRPTGDAPQHDNGAPQRDPSSMDRLMARLLDRMDRTEGDRAEAVQGLLDLHRQLATAAAEARAAQAQADGAERVLAEVRKQSEQQQARLRLLEAQHHDAMERILGLERMLGVAMAEIQRYRAMGPLARLLSKPNVPEPQQQPPLFLSGPSED